MPLPFDRKFGAQFVSGLPARPGVYRFFDSQQNLIYVGKAKDLRRRLSQYRKPAAGRKGSKARRVVRGASHLVIELCEREVDACLLESQIIRDHRPKHNLAGAFHFIYPLIGTKQDQTGFELRQSSRPEKNVGFSWHGTFRSRESVDECMEALRLLLSSAGYRGPRRGVFRSRPLSSSILEGLDRYLSGESMAFLEEIILVLLEKPDAIRRRAEVQEAINSLKRFWKSEIMTLKRARSRARYIGYPVPQRDRDELFIRAKFLVPTEAQPQS